MPMTIRNDFPAEYKPDWLTILIDSREQLPFGFDGFKSIVTTLGTGDYSFVGGEHDTRYERKSIGDLVACCGAERDRFERELVRLRGYRHRGVIVEGSYAEIELGGWRSAIKSASVIGSILGWQSDNVPFILAGDRQSAERYLSKTLFIIARRKWREARALLSGAETQMEGAA
jgi:ERCC4-type nuclease